MNTSMLNYFLVNMDFVGDIGDNAFGALLTDLSKVSDCVITQF